LPSTGFAQDLDARTIAKKVLSERQVAEEAERFSRSLREFVEVAWAEIKKEEPFWSNWHIDAICEHLEAVTAGEIRRLQVWIPPQSMKSMTVSVLWPAWEWTLRPWLRYWGASYETRLAGRLAAMSRDLMMGEWFQARWPLRFTRDAEHYFANAVGGTRLATSPDSTGTGEHGHRILIDDPINAKEADALSRAALEYVNSTWYDGTVSTRGIGPEHARIIIMQRLHENDLAAHVLTREPWVVLALPERYEPAHPFAWRGRQSREAGVSSGSDLGAGDPRSEDDLLWPAYRPAEMSEALIRGLGSHRAISQYQQRPAAREGELLKRHHWRFYHPRLFIDASLADRRPRFRSVVQSVDTPLKDKESNDLVAIQAWGVVGSSRYLLDLRKGHMNYSQARRAIIEQARYVRKLSPGIAHYILIENAGYGVELIKDLKKVLTGVTKIPPGLDGDKIMRAESASSDLEAGNCFLPGARMGEDELSEPDESQISADVLDFINSCALFPNATHDDDVDTWSQCMNWLRSRPMRAGRTSSPFSRRRRRVPAA
jgi:predicted phage terminase large subunit-like protein